MPRDKSKNAEIMFQLKTEH